MANGLCQGIKRRGAKVAVMLPRMQYIRRLAYAVANESLHTTKAGISARSISRDNLQKQTIA